MPDETSWQSADFNEQPKMSKKDRLKRYQTRLQNAKKWRKDEFDETWRRLIDIYDLKPFKQSLTDEDRIAVNIAFATINVIEPSISVSYPKITVNARKPESDSQAAITEVVTNYWWRHHEVKPEFRRAVKDFLVIGHGWLKVGYRFREKEQPIPEDQRYAMFQEQREQADAFAAQNPEMAAELPTDQDIEATLPQTQPAVVEDRPYVERVSPFDILVDPEATSMQDLKWIAQRVVRPIEEVKNDKRYSAAARRNLKADASTNSRWRDEDEKNASQHYSDDVKRCTIWEYYDIQSETMCVFTEMTDKFLIEPQDMPYSYGIPFVMMRNYDVPDQFYPLGDLEAIEPLNQELNKTRSEMMNHRKKYARKYLAKSDALDEKGRAALTSNQDNEIVLVDGDMPLNDTIQPVPINQMSPELYQYSDTIEADIDRVSGISEYQRGSLPDIRRTATEASIIQDAANSRAAHKLAIVEDSTRDVAYRLVALAQTYLTGEQVARMVGRDGAMLWIPFTREDIEGEFDFEVEAGSTQPLNETIRRQQAMQLLQTLQPYAVPGGPVNPYELISHTLKFGFGIKNPERFLAPPPSAPLPSPDGEGELPPAADNPAAAGNTLSQPGKDAIPPEILTQLQGQTGLNLGNVGKAA